ncbi:hypothetical protein TNCV_1111481 [Trichonephila clavipes]|nr:hypothetical protein TNCV_1111481 [Trichonephila clavipes]
MVMVESRILVLMPLKTRRVQGLMHVEFDMAESLHDGMVWKETAVPAHVSTPSFDGASKLRGLWRIALVLLCSVTLTKKVKPYQHENIDDRQI